MNVTTVRSSTPILRRRPPPRVSTQLTPLAHSTDHMQHAAPTGYTRVGSTAAHRLVPVSGRKGTAEVP